MTDDSLENNPIQRLVNAMNEQGRLERANYHLTLGQAIKAFEALDPDDKVIVDKGLGLGPVGSYRGYYSDLAWNSYGWRIDGSWEEPTVRMVLENLKAALNETFEGYKGGDFVMKENTPMWISEYGTVSGLAVMAVAYDGKVVRLITKDTHA